MNLHMYVKFRVNRPSRLVAFPEFVLRLVRLFAAVRADSRKNTQKNNIYTCSPSRLRRAIATARANPHSSERIIARADP